MQPTTRNDGYSPRVTRRAVNRLIVACKEDILAGDDAARGVRDPDVREDLHRQSRQRATFVDDLGRSLTMTASGGSAATGASSLAFARSMFRHVWAFVAGWNEGDGYTALVGAETRTAKAYLDALAGPLPDDVRFGVKRQQAQIDADLVAASRMRGLH